MVILPKTKKGHYAVLAFWGSSGPHDPGKSPFGDWEFGVAVVVGLGGSEQC